MMHRGFGILSFAAALVVYLLTVQPTVPFWDCGEFTSAAIWQQVPHPPGTPLFLMIGKIFSIIIPFGDMAWRVNLVSVFSSAFTVWLLYLISVKVIFHFRSKEIEGTSDALAIYGSSFIGAMALVFSDTFWFNAVESEVYALSALFVALVVYLMMKWNEEADNPGSEKYLLLIAYLMGLSTGVHLLSILAIFSIVYVVYFRKYTVKPSSFIITGIVSIIIFFIIYPGIVKWIPAMLAGHMPFKDECREYIITSPITSFLVIASVIVAAIGLWWGFKNKFHILNLICASFLLMILGYSTYTQILLRSNANPPMNENEPKTLQSFVSYIGREQYGEAPNWPRRYKHSDEYYTQHYTKKNDQGEFVYGEWIPPQREEVQCKDGRYMEVPKFKETNFMGEIMFLWKYQIKHMYIRYFNWNYVGRSSDVQDAGSTLISDKEAKRLNYDSGYKHHFPVRFFALPLIFGLIGLFFHFSKDKKMAFIYLLMFLMMGLLTAIAQNQQQPQPRERDYFYAGSFFVFCLWIGLGAYYLIKGTTERKLGTGIVAGILLASLILVPVNMAYNGWEIHSRAGNYIPFDYSYNILQSAEKDAIIFTNGDNDTFPVWYLQDVVGVRRDVRIVNLSLGNTLWYIDQLKNRRPWGAKKIPLSFSDDSLRTNETSPGALSYSFGEEMNVSVPLDREIMAKFTDDPAKLKNPVWNFKFHGQEYTKRNDKTIYLYRVQDKLVLDILKQTRLKRPVYFSITVGPDSYCGLDKYFRMEGMAQKVCPVVQQTSGDATPIEPQIMEKCLMNVDNSSNYSKTPKYGFKFRNLHNRGVYYDDVHRRLMITYRRLYLNYAQWIKENLNDPDKYVAILDEMNKNISPKQFPINFEFQYQIANMYHEAGAEKQFKNFAQMGIDASKQIINNPEIQERLINFEITGRYFGPHRRAAHMYELLGEYGNAQDMLIELRRKMQNEFMKIRNNPSYKQQAQRIQQMLMEVEARIDELKILGIKQNQGPKVALDSARSILSQYQNSGNQLKMYFSNYIQRRILEMEKELGIAPEDTSADIMEGPMMRQ